MKRRKPKKEQISFRRLVWEALPEMWSFQFVTKLILFICAGSLGKLAGAVAGSRGVAFTTANLKAVILSWQGPLLILLGMALVLFYILIELFAQVIFADNILKGRQAGLFKDVLEVVKRGIRSLRSFFTPAGILVLFYIFIAVPLVGLGFSISLTKAFYIPDFIMEVVYAKPLYLALYIAVILALFVLGLRYIFSMHGVLLSGLSPEEAMLQSKVIVGKNRKRFFKGMLAAFALTLVLRSVAFFLFELAPQLALAIFGQMLPQNYDIDMEAISAGTAEISTMDAKVLVYRMACSFGILVGGYLYFIVRMLSAAYIMLKFTRYYIEFTENKDNKDSETLFPARPKRHKYLFKAAGAVFVGIALALAAIVVGVAYSYFADMEEPVKLVAHRTGGYLASENSLAGLELAIEHGCYGAETDVQRTKDGYYIINHDDTFKRLSGVNRTPQDMTLAEIGELRIQSTMGDGEELTVPRIEDLIEASRGRIKLFIEMKGKTADYQMVDDLVKLVRDMDCVEDVALISLNYDIIDYAETNYPEFETGVLFFAAYGSIEKLNCDILMLEEEAATDTRILAAHNAGKQFFVWTANTERALSAVLGQGVKADAVITDNVELAEHVQDELDKLGDYGRISGWLRNMWD